MILNILEKKVFERSDIVKLLSVENKSELEELYKAAYREKLKNVGSKVYFRGIIEFSNICAKDCLYCGIRRSNSKVKRYTVPIDEILESAQFAYEQGYGSIVLQSGEREDRAFTDFVEKILRKIKEIGDGALGITLSVGEQTEEVYRRWFEAGAHRYLLRIETTNEKLYKALHPEDHSFERRMNCLKVLNRLGYQVGTGVMTGLPGQTIEDLADDIIFFEKTGVHMIGMGPFIPHEDTPLSESDPQKSKEERLEMGLKMIAVTRLHLKNVNIASTTALQALSSTGRELGLKAGANIIMPNLTDTKYRADYQLYNDKPCINENAGMCRGCLEMRVRSVGEEIGYNDWGDSPKFLEENRSVK